MKRKYKDDFSDKIAQSKYKCPGKNCRKSFNEVTKLFLHVRNHYDDVDKPH